MEARPADELERPYNWRPQTKPKKGRSKGRITVLIAAVLVTIFVVLVAYANHEIHKPQNSQATPFPFIVHSGDNYQTIANRLSAEGILHDSFLFQLDARLHSLGSHLEAGTFMLQPNMSIDQMIATLAQRPLELSILIPPGWRAEQIAERLDAYNISGKDFLHAVRHGHHRWLGFDAGTPIHRSLNGFLFPNTYAVAPNSSGTAFARIMVRQFPHFTPHMQALAARLGYTPYQVLTLASIVDRETSVQRAIVASVYYNRLRDNMILQADPTVQYAMGNRNNWWPARINTSVKSRFNTYRHRGLPPGPIDNPGLGSIRAALKPAHTKYLYFFAKCGTPYSVFATTLAQQNANAAKYGCH